MSIEQRKNKWVVVDRLGKIVVITSDKRIANHCSRVQHGSKKTRRPK